MLKKAAFLDKVDRKIGWMRLGFLPGGTMIMFDLNELPRGSTTGYGYAVGDEVIKVVAARASRGLPSPGGRPSAA